MGWSFGDLLANRTVFQDTAVNYQKFEADLGKGDNSALVEDYKAILAHQPSKPNYYQQQFLSGLNSASEEWAKSIDMGSILLTNTGVVGKEGKGPKDLGGLIRKADNTPVTLYDYLTNSELVCHVDLPEFSYDSSKNIFTGGYDHIYEGDLGKAADGTNIAHIQTGTQDVDFAKQLVDAFGGDFTWKDLTNSHNYYEFRATGKLSDFIKDGVISFTDPSGAGQAASLKFHEELLKLGF